MAQLVGQNCVRCGERIGDELDSRFCQHCRCPVHTGCSRPSEEGSCPVCGASAEQMSNRKSLPETSISQESGRRSAPSGSDIWYATDGWFKRWVKPRWEEDSGGLTMSPGEIQFLGRSVLIRMMSINGVELVGPFLTRTAVAALAITNFLILLLSAMGVYKLFTLDSPATYVMLAFVNALALASYPMRWVRVSYLGADGLQGIAYFTSASPQARWSGGARKLFDLFSASH